MSKKLTYNQINDDDRRAFIDLVRSRSVLWNPDCADPCKTTEKNRAFVAIAKEMGMMRSDGKEYNVDDLKKLWKTLRDNFRAYEKKRRLNENGSNGDYKPAPKWKFYDRLMFISDLSQDSSIQRKVKSDQSFAADESRAASQDVVDHLLKLETSQGVPEKQETRPSTKAVVESRDNTYNLLDTVYQPQVSSQITPVALSVNSVNNDLMQSEASYLAREFRNEISAVISRFEDKLVEIEREKYLRLRQNGYHYEK